MPDLFDKTVTTNPQTKKLLISWEAVKSKHRCATMDAPPLSTGLAAKLFITVEI